MDDYEIIKKQLDRIEKRLEEQALLHKVVLNFKETVTFLGLSEGHLYQLTSANRIPYYRPNGKKIYFKREELENWLLRNKQITQKEADEIAENFFYNKKNTA